MDAGFRIQERRAWRQGGGLNVEHPTSNIEHRIRKEILGAEDWKDWPGEPGTRELGEMNARYGMLLRVFLNAGCRELDDSFRDQLDLIAVIDHDPKWQVVFIDKVFQCLNLA